MIQENVPHSKRKRSCQCISVFCVWFEGRQMVRNERISLILMVTAQFHNNWKQKGFNCTAIWSFVAGTVQKWASGGVLKKCVIFPCQVKYRSYNQVYSTATCAYMVLSSYWPNSDCQPWIINSMRNSAPLNWISLSTHVRLWIQNSQV